MQILIHRHLFVRKTDATCVILALCHACIRHQSSGLREREGFREVFVSSCVVLLQISRHPTKIIVTGAASVNLSNALWVQSEAALN